MWHLVILEFQGIAPSFVYDLQYNLNDEQFDLVMNMIKLVEAFYLVSSLIYHWI